MSYTFTALCPAAPAQSFTAAPWCHQTGITACPPSVGVTCYTAMPAICSGAATQAAPQGAGAVGPTGWWGCSAVPGACPTTAAAPQAASPYGPTGYQGCTVTGGITILVRTGCVDPAAAAPQAVGTFGPTGYQGCTFWTCMGPGPVIPQQTALSPVCTTGIPAICNAAPQAAAPQAVGTIGRTGWWGCTVTEHVNACPGTAATICTMYPPCHQVSYGPCTGPAAAPQGVTLTPVCSTGIPVICNGAAAQAAAAPQGVAGVGTPPPSPWCFSALGDCPTMDIPCRQNAAAAQTLSAYPCPTVALGCIVTNVPGTCPTTFPPMCHQLSYGPCTGPAAAAPQATGPIGITGWWGCSVVPTLCPRA